MQTRGRWLDILDCFGNLEELLSLRVPHAFRAVPQGAERLARESGAVDKYLRRSAEVKTMCAEWVANKWN